MLKLMHSDRATYSQQLIRRHPHRACTRGELETPSQTLVDMPRAYRHMDVHPLGTVIHPVQI